MIAPLADMGQGTQSSFVCQTFDLDKVPADAVLRISALGLYRCFINGMRVGTDLLTPGWTCYDDRIAYQSYPIADLLNQGPNRIEIWLGDGWYRSQMMWAVTPIVNCWGDRIAAIAEIEADGKPMLATDATWRSGLLPVLKSGIYYGEDYDARVHPVESKGVEPLTFDPALLVPHETGPVVEMDPIAAIDSWTDAEGRVVYDFGQNVGGYARITVQGKAGDKIEVHYSEVLGPNRFFDNRNYRSARAQLHYTLKGGAPETYAPLFTFQGFRYARLTVTGAATVISVVSVPISSVPVQAGGFTCGVPEVNRLVLNTIWSQRGNFIEVPTDCPQRDERLGWTGDAQVFAGTACWLADVESFLHKYLRDVMADQRPNGAVPHFSPDPTRLHPAAFPGDWAGSTGWGDAITVIPTALYLHYGDLDILRETYPAMRKWVDHIWSISNGPIVQPPSGWGGVGFTFGDWLQPIGDNRKPRPTIGEDCAATLYHFISTDLAAKTADLIGKSEDARALHDRAEVIRAAFVREYFSASGRLAHNDQTSYGLAFLYGLVPPQHFDAAKAYFRDVIEHAEGKIGTGFIGTPALLPSLCKLGMLDLAERIFLNRELPGWLYQVERGAATIWERWDAMAPDGTIYDPDMNSYNHYAYGAVCQWLFEQVAGVQPDIARPGFDRVMIAPQILPKLNPVAAWHDCRHGRIEAGWTMTGDHVTYTVTLPKGCEGAVMPDPTHQDVTLNGAAVTVPAQGLALPSGRHSLTFRIDR